MQRRGASEVRAAQAGVPGAQSATVLTRDSWEQAWTQFILKAIWRGGTMIPFYTRGN